MGWEMFHRVAPAARVVQTQCPSRQRWVGTWALSCQDMIMLPQLQPVQAQIQVGNRYVSTNLSGKSVVLKFQWLKPVWDTEKHRGIPLSSSIMGKEKKEVHFISINTVFETGALSEKGLLCVDDKAGCIQISVTEHASLLKTYQHGAHSGARGFLGKTAPFCLTQTPPTELKLKDVLAYTMMSQQVQGTKQPTLCLRRLFREQYPHPGLSHLQAKGCRCVLVLAMVTAEWAEHKLAIFKYGQAGVHKHRKYL